jgi:hypothetical protein
MGVKENKVFFKIPATNAKDSPKKVKCRGGSRAEGRPPPPKIGKNMICWRKILIFHTKYPKNVRATLCSAQFF